MDVSGRVATLRFTADPTPDQERMFARHDGAQRFVHNHILTEVKSRIDRRKAGRWFASTQTCSNCGEKRAEPLKLGDRTFVYAPASACALVLNRDVNAARTIRRSRNVATVAPPTPPLVRQRRKALADGEKRPVRKNQFRT